MNVGCIVSFFTGAQESILVHYGLMELNFLKCSNIQTVYSIELKIGMYIVGHRPIYCIDFGEFRINSFFTGVQKIFSCITAYEVKLFKVL